MDLLVNFNTYSILKKKEPRSFRRDLMCILLTYTGNVDTMFLGNKANFKLILGNIIFHLFDWIFFSVPLLEIFQKIISGFYVALIS